MISYVDALKGLHKRFVAAQDRHPLQLGFAVAFLPGDEPETDEIVHQIYGNRLTRNKSHRYIDHGGNGSSPNLDDSTRDRRHCWLLKDSPDSATPAAAVKQLHSLARDICRTVNIEHCVSPLVGLPGYWWEALLWAVDRVEGDYAKRQWIRSEIRGFPFAFVPFGSIDSRHWSIEGDCLFAALAVALEKEIESTNKEVAEGEASTIPTRREEQKNAAAVARLAMEKVAAVVGTEVATKMLAVAADKGKSADDRMRLIYALDNQVIGKDSPWWAKLLDVTDGAVRQTTWWTEDRPRLRSGD